MILYSFKGQYPQQLPDRIVLSDGFTRTGGIYTPQEIANAGYLPIEVPEYDLNTHQLNWNGSEFSLELIPPPIPNPDWVEFSRLMLGDIQFNEIYQQLFTVNPLLAGSLQVALSQASLGRSDAFTMIWGLVSISIPSEYKNQWAEYAQDSHLPSDFIDILLS